MIQIVLMDGKKYINGHADFSDDDLSGALAYIDEALDEDRHSIIEISKWKDIKDGKGREIPRVKERK